MFKFNRKTIVAPAFISRRKVYTHTLALEADIINRLDTLEPNSQEYIKGMAILNELQKTHERYETSRINIEQDVIKIVLQTTLSTIGNIILMDNTKRTEEECIISNHLWNYCNKNRV